MFFVRGLPAKNSSYATTANVRVLTRGRMFSERCCLVIVGVAFAVFPLRRGLCRRRRPVSLARGEASPRDAATIAVGPVPLQGRDARYKRIAILGDAFDLSHGRTDAPPTGHDPMGDVRPYRRAGRFADLPSRTKSRTYCARIRGSCPRLYV